MHEVDFGWLAWAMELLQRDAGLSALLPSLRALALVPLSGGGWGSATEQPIYEVSECSALAERRARAQSLWPGSH